MNLLYITKLWPRKRFSAGHDRIFSIVDTLLNWEYKINFISTQKIQNEVQSELKLYPYRLIPFKDNLSIVKGKYDLCIFDTYQIQQKFAYEMYNRSNKTMRILDLQDIHNLRKWRQDDFVTIHSSSNNSKKIIFNHLDKLVKKGTKMFDQIVFAQNELDSIQRSDLVITCSQFEYFHLKKKIPDINICLFTFGLTLKQFNNELIEQNFRPFQHRSNFIFIGNMDHLPNQDAVNILIEKIWPLIHKQLPNEQLHIYGSNFNKELLKRNEDLKKINIRLMGRMESLKKIQEYKLMLAPLRFGAGVKGKIVDSWFYHTPVITTPIGSEGLFEQISEEKLVNSEAQFFRENVELSQKQKLYQKNIHAYYNTNMFGQDRFDLRFGGSWKNYTIEQFAQNTVKVALNRTLWQQYRITGAKIIKKNHSENINERNILGMISQTQLNLNSLRKRDKYLKVWDEYLLNSAIKKKENIRNIRNH